ncbi:MAG: acyl-[acyl-carrier-protein]--UDP-N-acetylglucosamine O-acyltransferase [Candidatus Omnitrophota bacterium]|nr:MAG: acyl-[acyl-carrier-protein]--UDP-N-acetylglucosamine O-acyltransferase [Candidatus Omnitrophota bacterium]
MRKIHPTAVVSPKAEIGENVEIGPYAVIEENVKIGDGTLIGPFVHICGYTEIGKNCKIFTGATVGSIPQDLKYKGEITYLKIGDGNIIREYVTINPATEAGESTIIGNNNLIMAYAHIAHNCRIGNNVIISNCGTLAGHVVIEDFAIIGGMVGIHQFCRVGSYSIVGGCSKITKDIIPFSLADGHPARPYGLNIIGLKRRNFPSEKIKIIKKAYKILFRSGLNISSALKELEKMEKCEEISHLIEFIRSSTRGIAKERWKK